ncbi:aspartyl-phosphate phosphatase Spo0E family protein [Clostridium estertheticum]|uniref:aspartyl-phosphate phosphatase Spo0E family protein n=1 Tax=Clostridium estertheticum TaxID=238834 RepID=UPI001C6EC977|nr:aspartyl-phosphate phosphatase Spo0E family protein [Clostridium estertheticum]MBW9153004.1 aspartyl-phosphate phosphatase Spo0E family protein [Clostridium estertheticum]WLC82633.1 aspartyl-phosphate phosphatase Spo0E family protein [Clostridium estertheticum]
MSNVILTIETLREELENLITLKGLTHIKVLKLSQILDNYILEYYANEYWKNREI